MRRIAIKPLLAVVAAAITATLGGNAAAHKLDLSMAGFIKCPPNDTGNPAFEGAGCYADVPAFEQFMMEYSFGLAPKILAPAKTLGYSGFYMGLEGTLTPRPSGDDAKDRWNAGLTSNDYPDVMFVPAVHIRKGLPWSLEVGSTLNYLAESELVGLGGEVKWAPFEGYRHGFRGALPDVAVRGSIMRILGESDVDMSLVSVDGSISYDFGIGGMVMLSPFAGFQYFWSIVRVEPLLYRDENKSFHPATTENDIPKWQTTGLSGPNLGRAKIFGGLKFGYEMLSITIELDWGLPKAWDVDLGSGKSVEAEVRHQISIAGGMGIDF